MRHRCDATKCSNSRQLIRHVLQLDLRRFHVVDRARVVEVKHPISRPSRALPGSGSWCAASRHFRWTEAWSGADLERTLQGTLPRVLQLDETTVVGSLLDLHIEERDASARVLNLEVRTTGGTWNVRGDPIRWVLKPGDRPLLRSLMFDLDIERQNNGSSVSSRAVAAAATASVCQMERSGWRVPATIAPRSWRTTIRAPSCGPRAEADSRRRLETPCGSIWCDMVCRCAAVRIPIWIGR
jgi:hypothetical protein